MEKPLKLKVVTNSDGETIAFAEKLVKVFPRGTIITLKGDLGAGKTHFVKGLGLGLGSPDIVSSPTFTILNIYEGGRMPLYHFDMYRLSSCEEAEELGFKEYFSPESLDGISVVEWPENVQGLITTPHIEVEIVKGDEPNTRIIYVGRQV